MAYVLGFFAADGSMLKNKRGAHYVEFFNTDKRIIYKIRSVLGSSHKMMSRKESKKHRVCFRFQLGSKEIFSDLQKLGFMQNKSRQMKFPEIPEEYFGDFVRGYFDGDGCIYFKKHVAKDRGKMKWVFTSRFTSGSRVFLSRLHELLGCRGVKKGFIQIKSRNSGYELVFSHRDSLALFLIMYHNVTNTELCVTRKYKLFLKALNTLYPHLRV